MKKMSLKVIFYLAIAVLLGSTALLGAAPAVKIKVVSELANVRLRPDIGSIIIQQFPKGAILECTGKEGEWFRIKFQVDEEQGLKGYVHESLVEQIEGEPFPQEIVKQAKEESDKSTLKTIKDREQKNKTLPLKKTPPETKVKEKETSREKVPPQIPSPVKPKLPVKLAPSQARVSAFLSGGGHFSSIGDLNRGSQGLANYYSDLLGIKAKGAVSGLKLVHQVGAEFLLPLSSKLSFLIGADYFYGQRESLVDLTAGTVLQSYTARPLVKAFPVRVGLAYFPFSGFYAKAGVEFILVNCQYFYRFVSGEFWRQWEGDANSQGLGFMGGIGVILPIGSVLGLFVEVDGRYAHIGGFEGTDVFTDSDGLKANESGKLFIYQAKISGSKTYSLLFVRDKVPTEAGVADVREASLNLNGLTLKAGLKIRF